MAGKKRIFISDIHMGTERSKTSKLPYGWLLKNASKLGRFLEEILAQEAIDELVIVGDLFDDWVIPSSLAPATDTFELICKAPQNKRIVQALKKLAASSCPIKVTYIPGNHDMAVTRKFIEQAFPGIKCAGSYNPGNGEYRTGNIIAEHGHRFCLINAPDTFSGSGSGYLPLGYFISRAYAQKCHLHGPGKDLLSALVDWIKNSLSGDSPPVATFRSVCEMADMKGSSKFKLLNSVNPSVSQISKRYEKLMEEWNASSMRKYGSATAALMADAGMLDDMVWDNHGIKNTNNKRGRIVVCGHTHQYAMFGALKGAAGYTPAGKGDGAEARPGFNGYHYLYVNSGCWVDETRPSTYVLTEEKNNRHWVRVMKYVSGTSVEMLSTYIRNNG